VSTYRGITVNGNRAYQSARTLQLETTTNGIGSDPGITALIVEGDESMHLTISLRDARELAGWLIEHAVDPEAAPDWPCPLEGCLVTGLHFHRGDDSETVRTDPPVFRGRPVRDNPQA